MYKQFSVVVYCDEHRVCIIENVYENVTFSICFEYSSEWVCNNFVDKKREQTKNWFEQQIVWYSIGIAVSFLSVQEAFQKCS